MIRDLYGVGQERFTKEKKVKKEPLLGAHMSIAGGVHNALLAGESIGATTIQIFTANQRTWVTKPISEEEIALFRKTLRTSSVSHVMSHDSYLINLGSPKKDVREKSIAAFREEIKRCQALGVTYLNFHPGAALDSPVETCLEKIVDALLSVQDVCEKGSLKLLVETMAGQGSTIGSRFEEIAYIIKRVKKKLPIGVCMDTCHTFAAGYDMRTKESLSKTLDEFDRTIGLKYLMALHLNDSKCGLGERKDRHSPIGEGMIGKSGFSAIMSEPTLSHLPKYLETPGGPDAWEKEIAWLKRQIP